MTTANQKTFAFDAAPVWMTPATAPYARASDTSRQAAGRIAGAVGKLQTRVFDFITAQGLRGATDEEIALGLGMLSDTARARRVELRDRHAIVDSDQRRPTRRGRMAVVWVATAATPAAMEAHTARPGVGIRDRSTIARPRSYRRT